MSRVVKTFCDSCGREMTGGVGEPELFVTMIVGKSGVSHYCFDCARYCLDAWTCAIRRIRKDKLVTTEKGQAHDA